MIEKVTRANCDSDRRAVSGFLHPDTSVPYQPQDIGGTRTSSSNNAAFIETHESVVESQEDVIEPHETESKVNIDSFNLKSFCVGDDI